MEGSPSKFEKFLQCLQKIGELFKNQNKSAIVSIFKLKFSRKICQFSVLPNRLTYVYVYYFLKFKCQ